MDNDKKKSENGTGDKGMKKGEKAAIVCCSNQRPQSERETLKRLDQALRGMGVIPVFGDRIYKDPEERRNAGDLRKEDD